MGPVALALINGVQRSANARPFVNADGLPLHLAIARSVSE
jgi:hypothetical protein